MALSLTELFRTLASFSPARVDLKGAPFDEYVDWAIAQGLAPVAAYNLEYRLGNAGAPQWARDRLLSVYQGTANDNVMKLVNFKQQLSDLAGRKVVLLGAASYAESVYPHVAFRPVVDLELLLQPGDVAPFVGYLAKAGFKPAPEEGGGKHVTVLSDTRTLLTLYAGLTQTAADAGLFERALPMKVMGPSIYRLDLEDALVVEAALIARAGFEVPLVRFVDLRELVLGAPSMDGEYSRPPDARLVLERAKALGVDRALWAALRITETLFPETAERGASLEPQLSMPVRELLERLVVKPVAEVGRTRAFRGEDTLRQALAGG